MNQYIKSLDIRWADLDPNFHVLHSRYYDFGAYCRMSFMVENGISPQLLVEHHIGPILFKEECEFLGEIKFGDKVTIMLEMVEATPDFRKWKFKHKVFINNDKLAAIQYATGSWMDTIQRKVVAPPQIFRDVFDTIPKLPEFIYI